MRLLRLRGDGASSSLPEWSAGGWPFPRVPPEFRASPRILRGSSLSGTPEQQAARLCDSRACPLLRRRQFRAVLESCARRTTRHLAVVRRTGLQPARTPLLGLSKDRPSADISSARPLPVEVTRKRVHPTPGPGLPPPGLVPPLLFFPASTVYSAQCLAGLLHPAADHGVRHVSGTFAVTPPCATGALPTRCCHRALARPAATPAPQDESWFARAARRSHPRQGVCAARPARSASSPLWCRHRCVLSTRRADVLQPTAGKPATDSRTGSVSRRVAFLVTHHPSESFPRRQPYRVTAAPCPLAVQHPRFEPSIRVAARLWPSLRCRRPQGVAPSSSPLFGAGLPLPAVPRRRRTLRRFFQSLHPILPWVCVTVRALPRRSADWLPRSGRGKCRGTDLRPPLPAGRRTLASNPRTSREPSACAGSRASSSTTDPENRLRGARRDSARGGGGLPTSLRPANSCGVFAPPASLPKQLCVVCSNPLPRPQHGPAGPRACCWCRHRPDRATEVTLSERCARQHRSVTGADRPPPGRCSFGMLRGACRCPRGVPEGAPRPLCAPPPKRGNTHPVRHRARRPASVVGGWEFSASSPDPKVLRHGSCDPPSPSAEHPRGAARWSFGGSCLRLSPGRAATPPKRSVRLAGRVEDRLP